jgi:hypothetical protein
MSHPRPSFLPWTTEHVERLENGGAYLEANTLDEVVQGEMM